MLEPHPDAYTAEAWAKRWVRFHRRESVSAKEASRALRRNIVLVRVAMRRMGERLG